MTPQFSLGNNYTLSYRGGNLKSLQCDTSGLLVKKQLLFSLYLLLCLALYFLPILLMLVFMQTHGETD